MRWCLIAIAVSSCGCAAISSSKGGGQTAAPGGRLVNTDHVALPGGYRIEVVAAGLNMPSGVTFDDQHRPVVVEAGYSYGEVFATPRLVRIDPAGQRAVIASGD